MAVISQEKRREKQLKDVRIGVVGLGLMGTSIATCLLAAGHAVTAIETDDAQRGRARRLILRHLKQMRVEGLIKSGPSTLVARLVVSGDYSLLKLSGLVVEAVTESVEIKRKVIRAIEEVVSSRSTIGTNTSGIPVTVLQQGALRPSRIVGIHWAEPAHTTRFMEIICGEKTDPKHARLAGVLARHWGKEPSILTRDVRGFITNRCMYALIREAFYLVESGYATVSDVDRSLRNDLGYWITFAGPFRFMDLTGIPAYKTVMEDLFPELSCAKEVPSLINRIVKSGGRGVSNCKGFYRYTPAQAKRWERLFLRFSYDIRALAQRYPEEIEMRRRNQRGKCA
jgi:3-hydroxyacyl-CoA dehydrogenase